MRRFRRLRGGALRKGFILDMLHYTTGDATSPKDEGPKVIIHICNDIGGWGKGFVMAISRRWPEPERQYRAWHRGDVNLPFELGQVQFVKVKQDFWVANLIGQRGLRRSKGHPPIRYEAVREGLSRVWKFAVEHKTSVHMPRIGCGLAGGRWEEMEPIIKEELSAQGVAVTVYDFE